MRLDTIQKEPFDEFGYAVKYHKVLAEGEKLETVTLTATKLNDDTDVTGTFLADSSATIPSGVATGGSRTTLINSIDHALAGFIARGPEGPGDYLVNETKGWSVEILEITTTTLRNDTLIFQEVDAAQAAASGDAYTAAKAIAALRAGSDGDRVKVTFKATSSNGQKFEDEVVVNVRDR